MTTRRAGVLRRVVATRDGRVALALLGTLTFLSFVLPVFLPEPNASHFALAAAADGGPPMPSGAHPLGTDPLYRDVLARLAAGGRVSLLCAGAAALLASLVGIAVGVGAATAARAGARWADTFLMRLVDVLLAMPFLLVITTIGVLVGRTDATTLVLVMGLTGWTGLARVVRSRALAILSQDFVLSSRALGGDFLFVALRHVLPNVAPVAIVLGTSLVGSMILAEAVLGYLSVGIEPPQATWGRMLHEAESLVVLRPLLVAAPGACIIGAMLGLHRLGEALGVVTSTSREDDGPGRVPVDVLVASAALVLLVALPTKELLPPKESGLSEEPVKGGDLHLATLYTVRTLDPATAPEEISIAFARLVFDRLLTFDADGNVAPALAEHWSWSEGGKALELELRHGVRFHDGAPLTAADVKRSIERALHPSAASPGASNYANLEGFEAYRSGSATELTGVVVSGEHRVIFRLKEPDATLPSLLTLSFVSPVCPSVPAVPETTEATLCGAGPFKIARFEPEAGLRLEKHGAYYVPGVPLLDAIELEFLVRPQAQRYRFEHGEIDFTRELSGSDTMLVRADPRWAPYTNLVPSLRVSAIFLNTEVAPFDNADIRRAVSFAIDPSVVARLRPEVVPLSRVVPDAVPGNRTPSVERRHDLAAALESMARAGYPFDPATGTGGYPEPIDYVTIPDTFEQPTAEIYQQQLARVGIRIRLRLLSHQSYLAEVQRRGRSPMGWAGWQADYPDPLTFFDPKLASSAIGATSLNNSFYSNPELDALVERGRTETNPRARDALFSRAEEIVARDAPWIPVTTSRVIELRQPWLRGYASTALAQLDFSRAWLARPSPTAQKARAGLRMAPFFGAALWGSKR
ncbi:MAG: ABC transporter permease subunit [Polyangiaceae bacterium]|nr:ABC transporter permease subunit [Polyangiaceae bacterium]